MIIFLFGFILLFITVLQAFTPKFLKQTEVFGVYVPEQYTKEKTIEYWKKRYTSVVLITGFCHFNRVSILVNYTKTE